MVRFQGWKRRSEQESPESAVISLEPKDFRCMCLKVARLSKAVPAFCVPVPADSALWRISSDLYNTITLRLFQQTNSACGLFNLPSLYNSKIKHTGLIALRVNRRDACLPPRKLWHDNHFQRDGSGRLIPF